MDLITAIASIPGIGPALPYVGALGVVSAVLATALPPPANTASTYGRIYTAVNWLGLNFGHARNANAPGAVKP